MTAGRRRDTARTSAPSPASRPASARPTCPVPKTTCRPPSDMGMPPPRQVHICVLFHFPISPAGNEPAIGPAPGQGPVTLGGWRVQLPGAVAASFLARVLPAQFSHKTPEPHVRRIVGGQLPGSGATILRLRLFCSPGKFRAQINRSKRSSLLRPTQVAQMKSLLSGVVMRLKLED